MSVDWEWARARDALVKALADLEAASRGGATSMAAAVVTPLLTRLEAQLERIRLLEQRVAALEAQRSTATREPRWRRED